MNIITRVEWDARSPRSRQSVKPSERRYFVVHHSGGPATQTVRAIQDWCMNDPPHGRGFADIDYNFLVRATTGEIYEGRGWDIIGSHVANYNTPAVGVCLIGTDQASDAAKRSVRWLYAEYTKRCHRELEILGHRDLATTGTDCPGNHVYKWVHAGMPAPIEEDDPMAGYTLDQIADAVVDKLSSTTLGASGPNWAQDVERTEAIQTAVEAIKTDVAAIKVSVANLENAADA